MALLLRRLARAAPALFVDVVTRAADGNDVPRLNVDAHWSCFARCKKQDAAAPTEEPEGARTTGELAWCFRMGSNDPRSFFACGGKHPECWLDGHLWVAVTEDRECNRQAPDQDRALRQVFELTGFWSFVSGGVVRTLHFAGPEALDGQGLLHCLRLGIVRSGFDHGPQRFTGSRSDATVWRNEWRHHDLERAAIRGSERNGWHWPRLTAAAPAIRDRQYQCAAARNRYTHLFGES